MFEIFLFGAALGATAVVVVAYKWRSWWTTE